MSGIVGIVNLDQSPVDQGLLREMTQHMAFRGPDGQSSWADSHVGLGHAMLRTTLEMVEEWQPQSLDGRVWITADARLDAREQLIGKLTENTSRELKHASDADLILHAYRMWDIGCVHHLLGDFAFAIWDASRRRLFCVRDHFGIRPFYYAKVGECLIFSNNLETIRRHPRVSDRLNDLAIVNFLLFRYQPKIDQTSFADIQSLMPAHTLLWEGGKTTISRYWTLPIEDPIRYKRHDDYVDHFRELLDAAVADRMRANRAGILMSGGIDSSSIAATIHRVRVQEQSKFALQAITYVYDRLIPDEERHYATSVARFLDLPIHFEVLDDKKWFDGWDRTGFRLPEPSDSYWWNLEDYVRKLALGDGVHIFYSGWGPDAMMSEPTRYGTLLRHGRVDDFVRHAWAFVRRYHQRPLEAGMRSWQRLRGMIPERQVDVDALAVLAPTIAELINIPKQWWQFPVRPPVHPWRPHTYSQLTDHFWTLNFQQNDAAMWLAPVEFRYPYFDLRLVKYLLRMPVISSFAHKALLREAMRGRLPELVRTRPKTPLAGSPTHSYANWVHRSNPLAPELQRYVDIGRLRRLWPEAGSSEGVTLRQHLIAIDHWLRYYK